MSRLELYEIENISILVYYSNIYKTRYFKADSLYLYLNNDTNKDLTCILNELPLVRFNSISSEKYDFIKNEDLFLEFKYIGSILDKYNDVDNKVEPLKIKMKEISKTDENLTDDGYFYIATTLYSLEKNYPKTFYKIGTFKNMNNHLQELNRYRYFKERYQFVYVQPVPMSETILHKVQLNLQQKLSSSSAFESRNETFYCSYDDIIEVLSHILQNV